MTWSIEIFNVFARSLIVVASLWARSIKLYNTKQPSTSQLNPLAIILVWCSPSHNMHIPHHSYALIISIHKLLNTRAPSYFSRSWTGLTQISEEKWTFLHSVSPPLCLTLSLINILALFLCTALVHLILIYCGCCLLINWKICDYITGPVPCVRSWCTTHSSLGRRCNTKFTPPCNLLRAPACPPLKNDNIAIKWALLWTWWVPLSDCCAL